MTSPLTPKTHRASFALPDEATARRVFDLLTESLFEGEAAVAACEGESRRWDITMHFAQKPDEAAIRELVALAASQQVAETLRFDSVEPTDWVKATLEVLVPVRAERFVVHGAHNRDRIPPNSVSLEIEAALAFGTGHHGTTRGCLLLLDSLLKSHRPRRVLDLGTGTGVLAIAAAKVLHIGVLATDIDAQSVAIAHHNAHQNGAAPWVQAVPGNGFSANEIRRRRPFDLILANILANPLRQMATAMARHLAPGGHLILSGLLSSQAASVIAAYRARGFVVRRHIRLEGWSSLLLAKAG